MRPEPCKVQGCPAFQVVHGGIGNEKFQTPIPQNAGPNPKQTSTSNDQMTKTRSTALGSLFGFLNFGHWNLFGICCLGFCAYFGPLHKEAKNAGAAQ
jgi:hypothetical protein